MKKIIYEFVDGSRSEVWVDDKYLAIHEALEKQEKRRLQKELKQKWRGGYVATETFSLDRYMDEKGDVAGNTVSPLDILIGEEESKDFLERQRFKVTDKSNEAYELKKKGFKNTEIAKELGISESAVRKRLNRVKEHVAELFL